ncbi:MAG: ribonuclease H-like domain-containing protein, partial [Bryobacterales bacterium]|nr:ribonuclease H-like domain-containing protein [Bryobacterales bacterium]
MSDIESQLEYLRRRIAPINRKYASGAGAAAAPALSEPVQGDEIADYEPLFPDTPPAESAAPEDWLPGEEVSNAAGVHFQTTRFWARHRRHGSMDISQLAELPPDLLDAVSEGTVPPSPPQRWVYLDTETTGLAGGTGTYAFLIGIGWATGEGFHLKQYFLRNPGEE